MKKATAGLAPTVLDFLQKNASTGSFMPMVERMLEIQQELRRCLPAGVAADCEVCGLEDGNLVIQVSSSSAASKLRQTLPRLTQTLTQQGWKINAIRLRLQPRNSGYESYPYGDVKRTAVQKHGLMPDSAVEQFSKLADSLEDSPLRDALEKAVRRRR